MRRAPRSATTRWSIPGSAAASAGTATAAPSTSARPRARSASTTTAATPTMSSCRTRSISIPTATLPVELACLYACSGITAFGAVKKAVGQDGGKPILVIGAGGVGLMGVRFAEVGAGPSSRSWPTSTRTSASSRSRTAPSAALDPRDKDARKQIMELTGGTGVGAAIDFVGAGKLGPVRPEGARPRRPAGRRRPVRRHLLDAAADVRLHRLPDRGFRSPAARPR